MKEKRMEVKMIGCELGDGGGGKMQKKGDGNWKKKKKRQAGAIEDES